MPTLSLMKTLLLGVLAVLALSLSGCTALALNALNASTRLTAGFKLSAEHRFGEQEWQTLDVYTPASAASVARPVLVFFYGGGWTAGTKEDYLFVADAFTRLGYVVVIPDYVKYPQGQFPSFIEDGALALAWVKSHIDEYGGNADQIVIAGHSAGAHLAAMLVTDGHYLAALGLERSDIKAMAGLAGPYNFTPEKEIYKKVFVSPDNYPAMQVANFIDGNEPPMWLAVGTKDSVVGESNLTILEQQLIATNGVYQVRHYAGRSHAAMVLALSRLFKGKATVLDDMHVFFKTALVD